MGATIISWKLANDFGGVRSQSTSDRGRGDKNQLLSSSQIEHITITEIIVAQIVGAMHNISKIEVFILPQIIQSTCIQYL